MQSYAKKLNRPEILAPAGNLESLRAAIINGADAVYLGASAFSARAKAGNFTNEELVEAVKYCHIYGAKVYLAVNTLVKPSEYEEALSLVKLAKEIGVDAIIVQDFAFLDKIHSTISDINIHLSTQAGIHNRYGARIAERLGASRIILSREVTLEDIEDICANTRLEVEVFVHGALCIGFSGNCYFSSLATGLSGNRGKCLQLCRKSYSDGKKNGYLLSPKDLDFSQSIKKLADLGVTSFKIEGRMKRPEYVGESVKCYREIIDGKQPDFSGLKSIFNRGGGCSGYLTESTPNLIHSTIQGHEGIAIGSVSTISGRIAKLALNRRLNKGDGIKFLRNGREVGNSLVSQNGNSVTFVGSIRQGDSVHLTTDAELISKISNRKRSIKVDVSLSVKPHSPITAKLSRGDTHIKITSDFCAQPAINAPTTTEEFNLAFKKTNSDIFVLGKFSCDNSNAVFARKSDLNSFRRRAYEQLQNQILLDYEKSRSIFTQDAALQPEKLSDCIPKLEINFDTIIQIDDLSCYDGDLFNGCAIAFSPKSFNKESLDKFNRLKTTKFISLPPILRKSDLPIVKFFVENTPDCGVIVNNVSQIEMFRDRKLILGPLMNCINPKFNAPKILSFEYDGREFCDAFVYTYGRIPLMTFAHCPRKTVNDNSCATCGNEITYADEQGNKFPMRFYKVANCYSQMLNAIPLCIFDKIDRYKIKYKFVDLIGCDKNTAREVLIALKKKTQPHGQFTAGYFSKKLQ